MRVVSGKYRGKKLKEFDLSTTKPTLDRVKESIFNLIQFDVMDSVVLDLFAGTGGLGVEAISRGAKQTYFVDNNPQAIKIIQENVKDIKEEYHIINQNYLDFLNTTKIKFDIVLLDPPYKTDYGIKAIEYLINNDKLNKQALIIFETADENNYDFNYQNFDITRKKYGTVAVYKMVKQD